MTLFIICIINILINVHTFTFIYTFISGMALALLLGVHLENNQTVKDWWNDYIHVIMTFLIALVITILIPNREVLELIIKEVSR